MNHERQSSALLLVLYCLIFVNSSRNRYFLSNSNNSICSQRRTSFPIGRKISFDSHIKIVLDEYTFENSSEIRDNYRILCSGVEITPHGKFVIRKTQRNCETSPCPNDNLAYFWMLQGTVKIDCSKLKRFNRNLKLEISSWLIDPEGLKARPEHSEDIFHLHKEANSTKTLDCRNNQYRLDDKTRRISIRWIIPSYNKNQNNKQKMEDYGDFPVTIDLYSRLYFRGNLGVKDKRHYCTTFDGFWCGSTKKELLSNYNSNTSDLDLSQVHLEDNDICIKSNLKCDGYTHCPNSRGRPISLDEYHCEAKSISPNINGSLKLVNGEPSRWYTKLPWMVLAFVPIVLVCALGRICSQKHNLEVIEYDENYDSCLTAKGDLNASFNQYEMQDLAKANNFHMSVKSLTPVDECREDEERAMNSSNEVSEVSQYQSNSIGPLPETEDTLNTIYEEEQRHQNYMYPLQDPEVPEKIPPDCEPIESVTLRENAPKAPSSSARNTLNTALKKIKNMVTGVGGSSNSSPSDSTSLVDFDYPPLVYSYQHDYDFNPDQQTCYSSSTMTDYVDRNQDYYSHQAEITYTGVTEEVQQSANNVQSQA